MYFASYDPVMGRIIGFREVGDMGYDTPTPSPYIVISGQEHTAFFASGQRMIVENGKLVEVPIGLDELKAAKLAELDQAAANAYVAGFYSTASGTDLYYDSDVETQTLLEGIYTRTKESDWATKVRYPGVAPAGKAPVRARPAAGDPSSAKEVQLLDAVQIKQLIDDLDASFFTKKATLWAKQAEVEVAFAAGDAESLTAVKWSTEE